MWWDEIVRVKIFVRAISTSKVATIGPTWRFGLKAPRFIIPTAASSRHTTSSLLHPQQP